MHFKVGGILVTICVLLVGFVAGSSLLGAGNIVFDDARQQSRQFIEWYQTIKLTPTQKAVKKAALEPLPAPCCSDKSAYTCCCKCNISRTMWGLAHYMIAKQGAGAEEVRRKVQEWVSFINPRGYSGQACYRRGCGRPFARDGCGGMNAGQLIF